MYSKHILLVFWRVVSIQSHCFLSHKSHPVTNYSITNLGDISVTMANSDHTMWLIQRSRKYTKTQHTSVMYENCFPQTKILKYIIEIMKCFVYSIYIIIRDCTRVGAFPRAFCVPNSVALASLTLQVVYWAIH